MRLPCPAPASLPRNQHPNPSETVRPFARPGSFPVRRYGGQRISVGTKGRSRLPDRPSQGLTVRNVQCPARRQRRSAVVSKTGSSGFSTILRDVGGWRMNDAGCGEERVGPVRTPARTGNAMRGAASIARISVRPAIGFPFGLGSVRPNGPGVPPPRRFGWGEGWVPRHAAAGLPGRRSVFAPRRAMETCPGQAARMAWRNVATSRWTFTDCVESSPAAIRTCWAAEPVSPAEASTPATFIETS